MPFSSLKDPIDVARAQAVLDAAWDEIRLTLSAEQNPERARERLAFIVVSLVSVSVTLDKEALVRRAIERFLNSA